MSEPNYDDLCFDPEKAKCDDLQTTLQNATILAEANHGLQAENDKLKDVLRLCRGRFAHYTAYDDEMMVKIIDKVLK